jgi:hypothetical protein
MNIRTQKQHVLIAVLLTTSPYSDYVNQIGIRYTSNNRKQLLPEHQ